MTRAMTCILFCTTKGQGSVLGYDRIWMHNLVIPASLASLRDVQSSLPIRFHIFW